MKKSVSKKTLIKRLLKPAALFAFFAFCLAAGKPCACMPLVQNQLGLQAQDYDGPLRAVYNLGFIGMVFLALYALPMAAIFCWKTISNGTAQETDRE